MKDFRDKTTEKSGTPLNRKNMMAIQGFIDNTITFKEDGSIEEKNGDGNVLRTKFNEDGSITQTFKGEKTITKTITFENNVIKEEIS